MTPAAEDFPCTGDQPLTERELLDSFTRIEARDDRYRFEVGIVTWSHPHEPDADWKCFRRWKTAPSPERIATAEKAALGSRRFFRRCVTCGELNNIGHMHSADVCQGCAESHLGVVY